MFMKVMCCVVFLIGLRIEMYGLEVVCSIDRLVLIINSLVSVFGYICMVVNWLNVVVLIVIMNSLIVMFFFMLVWCSIIEVGSENMR